MAKRCSSIRCSTSSSPPSRTSERPNRRGFPLIGQVCGFCLTSQRRLESNDSLNKFRRPTATPDLPSRSSSKSVSSSSSPWTVEHAGDGSHTSQSPHDEWTEEDDTTIQLTPSPFVVARVRPRDLERSHTPDLRDGPPSFHSHQRRTESNVDDDSSTTSSSQSLSQYFTKKDIPRISIPPRSPPTVEHPTSPCFSRSKKLKQQNSLSSESSKSFRSPISESIDTIAATPLSSESEAYLDLTPPTYQFADALITSATPTKRSLFGFLLPKKAPPPDVPIPSSDVSSSRDSHRSRTKQTSPSKENHSPGFFTPKKWKPKKASPEPSHVSSQSKDKSNTPPQNSPILSKQRDGTVRSNKSTFHPNGSSQKPNSLASSLITQVQPTSKVPGLLTFMHPGDHTRRQHGVNLGPFLSPQRKEHRGRFTLVLDLDETLVHSSFVEVPNYNFIIPVEIDGTSHLIYVAKRPGVDIFLQSVAQIYEVVIFTASLAKYADPLMDQLDPNHYCVARLFREKCVLWNGQYVKDLSRMGRDLRKIIILDNSPNSYAFQPQNAIPIESWFDDPDDDQLHQLIPILKALSKVDDIPAAIKSSL